MPVIDMPLDEVRRITRINTVTQARAKLGAKVAMFPDDPRAAAWGARLLEYEESLVNLMAGRPERGDPNAKVGVLVGVPAPKGRGE